MITIQYTMVAIYKIIDNTNGNIYIGKTKLKYLSSRLAGHRYNYVNNYACSSKEVIKNGNYEIKLIEETEDESREGYWIKNTNCVNKNIPGRSRKEHYDDNRDKLLRQKKEYDYKNKDNKKQKYKYQSSWGGDKRTHNNLLTIDPNLFF